MMFQRLLALLLLASPALAQKKPDAMPPPADVTKNLETLESLVPAVQTAEKDLAALRAELAKAPTDEAKKEITERVDAHRERLRQLRENFRIVATGVEDKAYLSAAEEEATFDNEFRDLLKPLFNGLREATAKPREMEELRSELRTWIERQKVAQAALGRVQTALAAVEDGGVKKELESARKLWSSRLDEATSETETLSRQIEEREKNTPSAWDAISGMFSDFWRSRGLNLLMAFGIALGVYILTRRSYRIVRKISPLHRRKAGGLMARSADLIVAAASVVLGVFAATLVFYLKGDWLMLAITIIFLIGLLWASKRALPPYIEQIKVILNLGSVRQGERLIYEGIPWRVDALHMYCDFSNPDLTGGSMRLPVKELLGLHSRPSDPKEPWFPTKENDWVKLDDGCFGKVIQQTPDQVVVLRLGGSLKTYPTADFIEQCPENLSRGFRVTSTFGVGYGHRGIATDQVPQMLQEAILRYLVEALGREQVRSVKVEFKAAAASSLDYIILADFSGEAASRQAALERMIQQACIEVCNEQDWDIPFPQMVIHQAG
jgi:predicted  nucleic acid-binding Zn-ribbon protein